MEDTIYNLLLLCSSLLVFTALIISIVAYCKTPRNISYNTKTGYEYKTCVRWEEDPFDGGYYCSQYKSATYCSHKNYTTVPSNFAFIYKIDPACDCIGKDYPSCELCQQACSNDMINAGCERITSGDFRYQPWKNFIKEHQIEFPADYIAALLGTDKIRKGACPENTVLCGNLNGYNICEDPNIESRFLSEIKFTTSNENPMPDCGFDTVVNLGEKFNIYQQDREDLSIKKPIYMHMLKNCNSPKIIGSFHFSYDLKTVSDYPIEHINIDTDSGNLNQLNEIREEPIIQVLKDYILEGSTYNYAKLPDYPLDTRYDSVMNLKLVIDSTIDLYRSLVDNGEADGKCPEVQELNYDSLIVKKYYPKYQRSENSKKLREQLDKAIPLPISGYKASLAFLIIFLIEFFALVITFLILVFHDNKYPILTICTLISNIGIAIPAVSFKGCKDALPIRDEINSECLNKVITWKRNYYHDLPLHAKTTAISEIFEAIEDAKKLFLPAIILYAISIVIIIICLIDDYREKKSDPYKNTTPDKDKLNERTAEMA